MGKANQELLIASAVQIISGAFNGLQHTEVNFHDSVDVPLAAPNEGIQLRGDFFEGDKKAFYELSTPDGRAELSSQLDEATQYKVANVLAKVVCSEGPNSAVTMEDVYQKIRQERWNVKVILEEILQESSSPKFPTKNRKPTFITLTRLHNQNWLATVEYSLPGEFPSDIPDLPVSVEKEGSSFYISMTVYNEKGAWSLDDTIETSTLDEKQKLAIKNQIEDVKALANSKLPSSVPVATDVIFPADVFSNPLPLSFSDFDIKEENNLIPHNRAKPSYFVTKKTDGKATSTSYEDSLASP
eukprot:GHVP01012639.1.p1 GENE.GHVP01012639.1~~GHVP01012639.1.p1  ORF type:complete len:308 (+),score=63.22 GHVP01012639.1:30-926(+)